ncbi:hypothetical protein KJ765_05105 [Candidatus Micrarchaeota archaeon]|nr:hypothetical protein [Candidatus Micrarchaeota archaeon]
MRLLSLFVGTLIMTMLTASVSAEPDLVVSDMRLSMNEAPVGEPVTIWVTTENNGTTWASQSTTRLYSNFGTIQDFRINGLISGQNNTNTSTYTCNQTGIVWIGAKADIFNEVVESQEQNNYRQVALNCTGPQGAPLADLVPDLGFSKSNPIVGETVIAYVLTRNLGEGASGASHTLSVEQNGHPHLFSVPSLNPGAGQNNSYNFTCLEEGTYGVNVTVDAWTEVNESDETNNFVYGSVECSSGQNHTHYGDGWYQLFIQDQVFADNDYQVVLVDISGSGGNGSGESAMYQVYNPQGQYVGVVVNEEYKWTILEGVNVSTGNVFPGAFGQEAYAWTGVYSYEELLPDLVAYVGISKSNPYVGETITISINTRNNGEGASDTSFTMSALGQGTQQLEFYFWEIPPLEPLVGAELNTYAFRCPGVGTYYVNATADTTQIIEESDETNNFDIAEFNCRKPSSGGSPLMVTTPKKYMQQGAGGWSVLASTVQNELEQEIQGLGNMEEKTPYEQLAARTRSMAASNPQEAVNAIQQARAEIAEIKNGKKSFSFAFMLAAVGAVAVASAWFFHGKRKKKIKMKSRGR